MIATPKPDDETPRKTRLVPAAPGMMPVLSTAWRQHICEACGTNFAYAMSRTLQVRGGVVTENYQKWFQEAFEFHPCPHCGTYQPEMCVKKRAKKLVLSAGCMLLSLLCCLVLITDDVASNYPDFGLFAALGVAVIGFTTLGCWPQYNRNPQANLEIAEKEIQAGILRSGTPDAVPVPAAPSGHPFRWLCIGLLTLGVVGVASANLVAWRCGWHFNPGAHTPVVSPGDELYVACSPSIVSMRQRWRGSFLATLVNHAELGLPALISETNRVDKWGHAQRSRIH